MPEDWVAAIGGLDTLTAGGILALGLILFLRALIRGDLVTRNMVDDIIKDRDYLREAFRVSQERSAKQVEQFENILISQETVVKVAESLRKSLGKEHQ